MKEGATKKGSTKLKKIFTWPANIFNSFEYICINIKYNRK